MVSALSSPYELQESQGRAVQVGDAWMPTHRACSQGSSVPAPWLPALTKRIDSIIAAEGEAKLYNRRSVMVDMGHPAVLYKTRGDDFFILGYQAAGRDGRVELTKTHAYLILGDHAYSHPLTEPQRAAVAAIDAATPELPPNFFCPGRYSKSRGEFIKRLQSGYVMKNGKDWLPTFKVAPQAVFKPAPMPEQVRQAVDVILAEERAQPSPNGTSRELATAMGVLCWSKWLDTRSAPRDGILDICVRNAPPGKDIDRVELTLQKGYILRNFEPEAFCLPPDVVMGLQEVFSRSPNPYAQGKTSFEPATGEAEARLRGTARIVVGVDESGRGNWAGPLTAAAVAVDLDNPHPLFKEVRDSKSYDPQSLTAAYAAIRGAGIPIGVGVVSAAEINQLKNLDDANREAFRRAITDLQAKHPEITVDCVLLDGSNISVPEAGYRVTQLPQGERHSMAIAAASVVATHVHHESMRQLGAKYPGLGFEAHHGAGNKTHEDLIRRHGLTPEHRTGFAPIKRLQRELAQRHQLEL